MILLLVAVDIDQTISRTTPEMVRFNNRYFGIEISPDEYQEHWSATRWNPTPEQQGRAWADAALKDELYLRFDPLSDARESLEKLRDEHHCQFVAATSRRTDFKDHTAQWLERHFPGIFNHVYYTGFYEGDNVLNTAHNLTKGQLLHQIGARLLIDDQIKHCAGANDYGIPAILFGHQLKTLPLPPKTIACLGWKTIVDLIDFAHHFPI